MEYPLALAHDIGSSSVKSSLIGSDGKTVVSVTAPYQTTFSAGGRAEQDPGQWWECVCQNTRVLREKDPRAFSSVVTIGVSGHMLGCLPVDRKGTPLHQHMLHADVRASRQFQQVDRLVGGDSVYRTTGNILDPKATLCKILWVKEELSQVYANTYKFLQCKDYIVGKLTGNFDSTDFSDASHAQLLDVGAKKYASSMLSAVGIDEEKLPHVHAGCDVVGKLSDDAAALLGLPAGLPVVAGGGDGACANIGAGVAAAGDTYCCLGTTAWIASVADQAYIDPQKRIFNIMTLDGDTCAIFGTMQCAGRSIAYVNQLFDTDFKTFDAMAAKVSPGSGGLLYLPYLEGERSPIFDFNARGSFIGMNPTHTRGHYYRACMEGVAYNLRVILDAFREKLPVDSMRIIGGGAKSDFLVGLIADICGVPIARMTTPAADATSLGAAVAAFMGAGVYASLAQGAAAVQVKDTVEYHPQITQEYTPYLEVFKKLYPALKDVFPMIAQLS